MRLGYGYSRNLSNWWYFYIPGFLPINGYVWSGKDDRGVSNTGGDPLWKVRLILLKNHFRPTHRWLWDRFIEKSIRDGYIK